MARRDTYFPSKGGTVTDKGYYSPAERSADAELLRRAIARYKRGKGGPKTQARLKKGGYNFAGQNPPRPQRSSGYQNPGRPA